MKSVLTILAALLLQLGVFSAQVVEHALPALTGDPASAFLAGDNTFVVTLQTNKSALFRGNSAGYKMVASDPELNGTLGQTKAIPGTGLTYNQLGYVTVLANKVYATTLANDNSPLALYDLSGFSPKLLAQKGGTVAAVLDGFETAATVTGVYWSAPTVSGRDMFYLSLQAGGKVTSGFFTFQGNKFALAYQLVPANLPPLSMVYNVSTENFKIDRSGRFVYLEEGSLDGLTLSVRIIRFDPQTGKKETLFTAGQEILGEKVWTSLLFSQDADSGDILLRYGVGDFARMENVEYNRLVRLTEKGSFEPLVHPSTWKQGTSYPVFINSVSSSRFGVAFGYSKQFVPKQQQSDDCVGSWTPEEGALPVACNGDTLADGTLVAALGRVAVNDGPQTTTFFLLQSPSFRSVKESVKVIRPLPVKIPAPSISSEGIVNALSNKGSDLAAGMWTTLYGQNLCEEVVGAQLVSDEKGSHFPTTLCGLEVMVNGQAAALQVVTPNQINFLVPDNVTPGIPATVKVVALKQNQTLTSKEIQVPVAEACPGLAESSGQTIAFIAERGQVTPFNRPQDGDMVTIYGSGFGPTSPFVPANEQASTDKLTECVLPISVTLAVGSAEVKFCGLVPGSIGLYQINFLVHLPPSEPPDGDAPPPPVEGKVTVGGKVATITL